MEPGRSKWSLIESHVIRFNKNGVQMEPGRSKWSLGGPNGAWEVQMEPGRSKWSLIESHVISFNKNDVQKWSLGFRV
jgi:hypothetical protein